jgi:DNA (cytosine-5)-methyltransferase 1
MIDAKNKDFTFIDLFAGIGGFRIAFESVGGNCVFASEWDKLAAQTYAANFGHKPEGDITQIPTEEIPDHDILTGGFPCQPFSIAGVTKPLAMLMDLNILHRGLYSLMWRESSTRRDRSP